MKYILFITIVFIFNGCIVNSDPHAVFINGKDLQIGKNINFTNKYPTYYKLTNKSIDKEGKVIYHFFLYERLKNPSLLLYEQKGIKGKCLIYYVVDPKTNIIIDWGFDIENGGNPKSCNVTG